MSFAKSELIDADIVFLLDIDVQGKEYRFSTFPVYIFDGDSQIPYEGELEDIAFDQSLNQIGRVKKQIDSISLALNFPFNVAQRQMKGKGIELSKCKLYYVLERNGQIETNAENRVLLYTGVLTDPIYGHPNEDVGYVEFSIENEIVFSDQSFLSRVLGENIMIEAAAFSAPKFSGLGGLLPPVDVDGIIDVKEMHRGKASPIVIGDPGVTTDQRGNAVRFGASPAYLIAYTNTAPNFEAYYLIAGHPVLADTVKMYDNKGNNQDNLTVYEYVSRLGETYSYIILDATTPIDRSFVVNTDIEYWIEWDDGEGLPSAVGPGSLTGGGDLCIYALNSLGIDYDRESWQSIRDRLNQYKFSGYINDPKIKMFQWLEKNVIAYLPIAVSAGPKGLTPILDLRLETNVPESRLFVVEGPDFKRVSPLQPISAAGQVLNDLVVQFGPKGFNNPNGSPYSSYVRSSYRRIEGAAAYEDVSPYAILSYQRYGSKYQVVSLDYVYQQETASKIANNFMRLNALPSRSAEYEADLSYGYLELGDIIELSDSEIGLEEARCQIIGKKYENSSWIFDILIEDNPILNQRMQ